VNIKQRTEKGVRTKKGEMATENRDRGDGGDNKREQRKGRWQERTEKEDGKIEK
jgi:hypothetical protein